MGRMIDDLKNLRGMLRSRIGQVRAKINGNGFVGHLDYPEIVKDYSEYVALQKGKYCSHEVDYPHWELGQRRYLDKAFGSVPRDAKIIDIACGDGVGLRHFRELGFTDIAGVEFNAAKAKKAAEAGYYVYQHDMHDLGDIPDCSYDIVYSSHTLEHAYNPKAVIREFRRILRSPGSLFVVLPYPDRTNRNDEAHGGKFELGTHILDNGKALVQVFVDQGFLLAKKSFDYYREDEIWLVFRKREQGVKRQQATERSVNRRYVDGMPPSSKCSASPPERVHGSTGFNPPPIGHSLTSQ